MSEAWALDIKICFLALFSERPLGKESDRPAAKTTQHHENEGKGESHRCTVVWSRAINSQVKLIYFFTVFTVLQF